MVEHAVSPSTGTHTIFALATAAGRAAVAIIRLSGPASAKVCQELTGRPPPAPRRAVLRHLREPASQDALDAALVLWFPAPASLTGEDVLELQVHGGRAVISGLLSLLSRRPGLRPAEPGEFARRAFLNGRMDLTAAEGLADLIAAETGLQARQALRQLDGELGRLYAKWRDVLLSALARLEAEIDFAPEEDVPDDLLAIVRPEVQRLVDDIGAHLADDHRGERLREGLTIAVIGPPNAGKSSLVNILAKRDVAIVTARPGTTRDVLEVHLELAGYPVTLLDTAGLRAVDDEVEAEGVRRARARAEAADLRLAVFDGALWPEVDTTTLALLDRDSLVAINKADLGALPAGPEIAGRQAIVMSCHEGRGLDVLLGHLGEAAAALMAPGSAPLITRARHRAALTEASGALARFGAAPAYAELALLAEELRVATRAIGRITGMVRIDEVLDRIFSEFCIGK